VKQFFLGLKQRIMTLNPSRLLSSILLGFILVIYVYLVYVIVVSLGTFPFGKIPNGSLLPSSDQRVLNVIALLVLSLTFVPISRWLQGHINDLIYAQHDNPYAIPALINQQLRGMHNPHLTLNSVVETLGTKLHLPYVALVVDNPQQTFTFGTKQVQAAIVQYPVRYLDQPLGMLVVSNRGLKRPFTDSDDLVLRECAQQIGVALYVLEITAVLQTAREQIVIAREAERRRIRNDLHDGLAPTLAASQLQLGAISKLLAQDPTTANQIIQELRGDLRQATADIRQLVYDLRPPLLDELGLIAAIKNMRLAHDRLNLTINAPEPLPTLPAASEVAIYRITSEALHNIVKHTEASRCTVDLTIKAPTLTLIITDDGQGVSPEQVSGIGIQSMRERAAELGGTFIIQPITPSGTQITVQLPWINQQEQSNGKVDPPHC
jgi:signal transduction histidine kinase